MDEAFTHNAPPLEFDLQFVMFVEFRLRLADESAVNNPPPLTFSEVHSVIFIEFMMIEDDEPFRYNAPPLDFAVQFVISVEFTDKLVSCEMMVKNAPPQSDEQFAIIVEFTLSVDDDPLRYNAPPLD